MKKKAEAIDIFLIILLMLSIISALIMFGNMRSTETYAKIDYGDSEMSTDKMALSTEEILKNADSEKALNIILIIDISSTMQKKDVDTNGTTRLGAAINSTEILVEKVYEEGTNRNITFSLIAFDNDASIQLLRKGYNDKQFIINRANQLPTDGYGTNMYAALVHAEDMVKLFREVDPSAQNVVIFLGDGSPYGYDSNNTYSGIIKKATELKELTTIYTVGFGRDVAEVSTDPKSGYYILSNMATEGNFSTVLVGTELTDTLNKIIEKLNLDTV